MKRRSDGSPDPDDADLRPGVTPDVAAEAALWVARLHGPDRDPAMEREFQVWQARSPAHREAFGRCTDVWQDIPRIKLADAYGTASASRSTRASLGLRGATWRWAAVSALAIVFASGAMWFQQWREQGAYSTAVGEQRLIVLDDGSRVLLNTDTRVKVDLGSSQRTVEVGGGEALFEVAKDASRPFVVRAAGSEVVALGTAFSVRFAGGSKDDVSLAVTLIEGRVDVRPASERGAGGLAPSRAVVLQPGDRLQLNRPSRSVIASVVPTLDRPNVEQVMAWKRREAVFQESALSDAVQEMNRYSRTQVVLSGEVRAADLRVSGVFHTGDNAGFARAVAALHGLGVREVDGRLELTNVR